MNKKIKALVAIVCVVVVIGISFGVYALAVNFGTTTINLDASKTYQTMNGFGASSAWLYQDLGTLEDDDFKDAAMQMLYGDSGLALNTFRYNVGAGGVESDSYEDPLRGAESYFVAENFNGDYSVFADPSNYDFSKDAAVRDLFERALATGNISKIVFFANSPHYLMTLNGKTHGENRYDNNLKRECYEAFSDYMLVIVDYLYQNIVCKYASDIEILISPVNEPQWTWGGEGATQEGCHYDPAQLAEFYDVFYKKLKAFNAAHSTEYIMDIFESGNYKMVLSKRTNFNEYMTEFEKYEYFQDITHISVHSYGADQSKYFREVFAEYMATYYPQISVSVSEYCTMVWNLDRSIDMGLWCGKVMLRDLAILGATDWQWWLSIAKSTYEKNGEYEDGLVYWFYDEDKETGERSNHSLDVTKRYYVMGQFSKYISEGSVRIKAGYSDFLSMNGVECVAFKNLDGSITLIALNDSESERKIKINGGYANVKEITTNADVNWQIREYENKGSVTLSGKSVTTFVFTK
ncbi:MAG: hypothetical protein K2N57_00560 [Clostridia bacterium]|nr:hypothetical protein [Clostridia bacterium]